MKKEKTTKSNTPGAGKALARRGIAAQLEYSLRSLILAAVFAAMSVILGYYVSIKIGSSIRIGFGSLPILMAGLLFGSAEGAIVALVADFVGCAIFYGFGSLIPLVTVGAITEGLLIGLFAKKLTPKRVIVGVTLSHTVSSVFIKSLGLWLRYRTPWQTLLLRPVIAAAEIAISCVVLVALLCTNKTLVRLARGTYGMEKMSGKAPKKSLTYEEAMAAIAAVSWQGSRPGLERITELLEKLHHPERHLACLHVAGTNGKGSTSAMLASIYQAAGYRVGLFTSPYIEHFNERIRVDGVPIGNESICRLMGEILPVVETMADPPTEFELITALGFLYFEKCACDLVILEVGMGGRLDATNVISQPILSVITGIALDHTAVLGDTVEKIAAEKAGIIKPSAPVLYGGEDPAARAVIAAVAKEKDAPFFMTDRTSLTVKSADLHGSVVDYGGLCDLYLPLCGLYQPQNLATVITALHLSGKRGFPVDEKAIRQGLAAVRWPARFELLREDPTVVYDGSHNPQGVQAVCETITRFFPGDNKPILVTGVMADKDYTAMAATLAPLFAAVYTLTPDNPRSLPAEELASVYRSLGLAATPCASAEEAIAQAAKEAESAGKAIIALGSLYMYKEMKEAVMALPRV